MLYLNGNKAFPFCEENGGFVNERYIDNVENIRTLKYFLWLVFNNTGNFNFLDSCFTPVLEFLYNFMNSSDNPNNCNIHRYVSYGGHVPILAIYFPALGQEFVYDNANMFYMNRTTGGYSDIVYEISRTNLYPERIKFLKLNPEFFGITVDFFPVGPNGHREYNPVRTSFFNPKDMNITGEDSYHRVLKVYSITLGNMLRIVKNYIPEMKAKSGLTTTE